MAVADNPVTASVASPGLIAAMARPVAVAAQEVNLDLSGAEWMAVAAVGWRHHDDLLASAGGA